MKILIAEDDFTSRTVLMGVLTKHGHDVVAMVNGAEAWQAMQQPGAQAGDHRLDDVRTLRGIIPICASCKKIRDDQGYWNQVEVYVSDHTEAEFSHCICPECIKKLYPGFASDDKKLDHD